MKRIIIAMVALAATMAAGQEQTWEGDLASPGGQLHGMIGVTWESQYIWRGFDVYDDTSVTHLQADLDLFGSGFGLGAVGHRANSSGFEDGERWDYTAYYQSSLFAGQRYATNFRVGWMYYNYPELWPEEFDLQEGHAILAWPSILPIQGLQPSYVVIKMWPAKSGSFVENRVWPTQSVSGWMHILMLDYGFTIPGIVPDIPEHVIRLHSELVHNDGTSPYGTNIPSGFSHVVFGASTDFMFGDHKEIVLTPAVYYQASMEETVNPDDSELWVSIGLKYTF